MWLGYMLENRGTIRISEEATDVSLLQNVQTGSGAHPSPYSISTGAFFPEVKRLLYQAKHSPPSST
jgi:hypothetical protein